MEDSALRLLITNDDGIDSALLRQLALWFTAQSCDVTVVAPSGERSGVGHGFTYRRPLQVHEISNWPCPTWTIDGLPADCVKMGVNVLMSTKPDLVISGPNLGANAGRAVIYSGTVAAAREAILWGVPGVALSLPTGSLEETDLLRDWLKWAWDTKLWSHLNHHAFWNINFPENFDPGTLPETVVCSSGTAMYRDQYVQTDRGWLLQGLKDPQDFGSDDDDQVVYSGRITLVPHHLDTTATAEIQRFNGLLSSKDLA